ncbi:MAG: serine hydrolase domain-containing protein [Gammaproteobacteria bacterium]
MHRRAILARLSFVCMLATAGAASGLFSSPVPAASAGDGTYSPNAKAAITRQLEQAVQRGDTPGAVGVIVDRDGTLYEAAAGKADVAGGTPMRTDAIFNIASMTKPVTTVAIMQLFEQGKLGLDDPVSKYLPGFDKLQVLTHFNEADGTFEARPAKRVMTLRHLLTHTSGIGYGFSSPILVKLQKPGQNEWDVPLLHEPGEKWTYGASTRVLGMIVEKISGVTLEAYFQPHILKPLGMHDTSFAVPAEKQSRVPPVQQRTDGALQQQPAATLPVTAPVPSRGDGGLYSTAHDYGLFVRMLLNGGTLGSAQILSERSVKLMGQNQIGAVLVRTQPIGLPQLSKPFPLGAGRDKFGLGFQITGKPAESGSGGEIYRSPGSLSWAGIYNTEFWVDPQRHVGGVLMMQVLPFYDDGAIRTLREFEAAAYRGLRVD